MLLSSPSDHTIISYLSSVLAPKGYNMQKHTLLCTLTLITATLAVILDTRCTKPYWNSRITAKISVYETNSVRNGQNGRFTSHWLSRISVGQNVHYTGFICITVACMRGQTVIDHNKDFKVRVSQHARHDDALLQITIDEICQVNLGVSILCNHRLSLFCLERKRV